MNSNQKIKRACFHICCVFISALFFISTIPLAFCDSPTYTPAPGGQGYIPERAFQPELNASDINLVNQGLDRLTSFEEAMRLSVPQASLEEQEAAYFRDNFRDQIFRQALTEASFSANALESSQRAISEGHLQPVLGKTVESKMTASQDSGGILGSLLRPRDERKGSSKNFDSSHYNFDWAMRREVVLNQKLADLMNTAGPAMTTTDLFQNLYDGLKEKLFHLKNDLDFKDTMDVDGLTKAFQSLQENPAQNDLLAVQGAHLESANISVVDAQEVNYFLAAVDFLLHPPRKMSPLFQLLFYYSHVDDEKHRAYVNAKEKIRKMNERASQDDSLAIRYRGIIFDKGFTPFFADMGRRAVLELVKQVKSLHQPN